MEQRKVGQIFWLVISLLSHKKVTYARPFLVYKVNDVDYILLKITNSFKDYIPQFEFTFANKPSALYRKDKKSFVDSNILIYISHSLFSYKVNEIATTMEIEEQGQPIHKADFKEIKKKVAKCFNNNKFNELLFYFLK